MLEIKFILDDRIKHLIGKDTKEVRELIYDKERHTFDVLAQKYGITKQALSQKYEAIVEKIYLDPTIHETLSKKLRLESDRPDLVAIDNLTINFKHLVATMLKRYYGYHLYKKVLLTTLPGDRLNRLFKTKLIKEGGLPVNVDIKAPLPDIISAYCIVACNNNPNPPFILNRQQSAILALGNRSPAYNLSLYQIKKPTSVIDFYYAFMRHKNTKAYLKKYGIEDFVSLMQYLSFLDAKKYDLRRVIGRRSWCVPYIEHRRFYEHAKKEPGLMRRQTLRFLELVYETESGDTTAFAPSQSKPKGDNNEPY